MDSTRPRLGCRAHWSPPSWVAATSPDEVAAHPSCAVTKSTAKKGSEGSSISCCHDSPPSTVRKSRGPASAHPCSRSTKVSESTATPRKTLRQVCPPSDVENTPDDVAAKPAIRSANHNDDTPGDGELWLFPGVSPPARIPATRAAS